MEERKKERKKERKTKFLKWTFPFLNLDMSTAANTSVSSGYTLFAQVSFSVCRA